MTLTYLVQVPQRREPPRAGRALPSCSAAVGQPHSGWGTEGGSCPPATSVSSSGTWLGGVPVRCLSPAPGWWLQEAAQRRGAGVTMGWPHPAPSQRGSWRGWDPFGDTPRVCGVPVGHRSHRGPGGPTPGHPQPLGDTDHAGDTIWPLLVSHHVTGLRHQRWHLMGQDPQWHLRVP